MEVILPVGSTIQLVGRPEWSAEQRMPQARHFGGHDMTLPLFQSRTDGEMVVVTLLM